MDKPCGCDVTEFERIDAAAGDNPLGLAPGVATCYRCPMCGVNWLPHAEEVRIDWYLSDRKGIVYLRGKDGETIEREVPWASYLHAFSQQLFSDAIRRGEERKVEIVRLQREVDDLKLALRWTAAE